MDDIATVTIKNALFRHVITTILKPPKKNLSFVIK
jgi:hypothetical protein